jgi:hypothetical protein
MIEAVEQGPRRCLAWAKEPNEELLFVNKIYSESRGPSARTWQKHFSLAVIFGLLS